MTENSAAHYGSQVMPNSGEELREKLQIAKGIETPIQFPLGVGTVDTLEFLKGSKSIADMFGPVDSDTDRVKRIKEKEMASLRSLLGENAKYLSMPLLEVADRLSPNVTVQPDNEYISTPYTTSLRLGTEIAGVYYHMWAQPTGGASRIGASSQLLVTQHVSTKR